MLTRLLHIGQFLFDEVRRSNSNSEMYSVDNIDNAL